MHHARRQRADDDRRPRVRAHASTATSAAASAALGCPESGTIVALAHEEGRDTEPHDRVPRRRALPRDASERQAGHARLRLPPDTRADRRRRDGRHAPAVNGVRPALRRRPRGQDVSGAMRAPLPPNWRSPRRLDWRQREASSPLRCIRPNARAPAFRRPGRRTDVRPVGRTSLGTGSLARRTDLEPRGRTIAHWTHAAPRSDLTISADAALAWKRRAHEGDPERLVRPVSQVAQSPISFAT